MTRQQASAFLLVSLGLVVAIAPLSALKAQAADPDPGSVAILKALRENPLTAPYRFAVTIQGRQYALSGRVGTKMVHDAAIRTLIALGYPIRDNLTIDTGLINQIAAQNLAQGGVNGPAGPGPGLAQNNLAYVYPPPLFGRLDDPFYGLEPPPVSYSPWFGAVASRREPINLALVNGAGQGFGVGLNGGQNVAAVSPVQPAAAADGAGAAGSYPVDMTLDSRGVATLRGQVPTLADRVAVGQEIARTPGIVQVVNLLQVTGNAAPVVVAAAPAGGRLVSDTPPPPPTPAFITIPAAGTPSIAANPVPDNRGKVVAVEGTDALSRSVSESIARRPALAASPVKVSTGRDGVVTISGQLPSSYEAMLAFRAAQQTPGVREVVDRLEFPIPDTDRPNPLRDRGRPEDVEAYLLSQVRRQVGDLAHVDQVRLRGDALEIRGTVSRADDVPRVEAALRSIPLLRGFKLESSFPTD